MKTTEKKNTRRPGAPNIACLPTGDGGDCPRKERSGTPVGAAAGGENNVGHLQPAETTDRLAYGQYDESDDKAIKGHGSDTGLGIGLKICQEDVREFKLDRRGNAAIQPVLHALHSPSGLVIAQQFGNPGGAAENFDAVFVGHKVI